MSWFDTPRAIRAAMAADTTITGRVATRIHYQELPESSVYPHVYFVRTGRDDEMNGDATDGLLTERYVVEIVGDKREEALVDAIVDVLESIEDVASGGRIIQLVQVDDADDQYVFVSTGEGQPKFLHALQVVVFIL